MEILALGNILWSFSTPFLFSIEKYGSIGMLNSWLLETHFPKIILPGNPGRPVVVKPEDNDSIQNGLEERNG